MMASRGMGDIAPSKMPGKKVIHRKDNPDAVDEYKKGGLAQQAATAIAMKEAGKKPKKMAAGGSAKSGLYANIHKKQARIAAGSGEHMRKPGSKGAPTKDAFIQSAKTAKKK